MYKKYKTTIVHILVVILALVITHCAFGQEVEIVDLDKVWFDTEAVIFDNGMLIETTFGDSIWIIIQREDALHNRNTFIINDMLYTREKGTFKPVKED